LAKGGNPERKSWSSRLRIGHKASYHTPLKKIPQTVKLMEKEEEEDSPKPRVFR